MFVFFIARERKKRLRGFSWNSLYADARVAKREEVGELNSLSVFSLLASIARTCVESCMTHATAKQSTR